MHSFVSIYTHLLINSSLGKSVFMYIYINDHLENHLKKFILRKMSVNISTIHIRSCKQSKFLRFWKFRSKFILQPIKSFLIYNFLCVVEASDDSLGSVSSIYGSFFSFSTLLWNRRAQTSVWWHSRCNQKLVEGEWVCLILIFRVTEVGFHGIKSVMALCG